jgi:chitinase
MHISAASQAAEKHWVQMGIQEATPYVDQWNVMSYDYAVPDVPGGAAMSPNSPLYTPKTPYAVQMSINYTIQGYLKAGVPANKILLGIPLYGHTWYQPKLGTDAWRQFGLNGSIQGECCGPFKQTYGAKPGKACQQCGVYMYSEILAALGGSEASAYHDKDTESDIAYLAQAGQDGYTEAGTWITYSGAKSIAAIIDYTKKNNLAGAFIFDTSMDTVSGGAFTYTLMNQIADGLGKPKQSSSSIFL